MSQIFCVNSFQQQLKMDTQSVITLMNTRSSNFLPLDFVAQSARWSLEFVVGHCHGQSLLAVE
jgi:hypothetical protein